jgi:rhamnose utilization protein RhaD (predicted bifunctional aldolase and dehydrogenase)
MINQIIRNSKRPGVELARKIVEVLCETDEHKNGLFFYLLGHHGTINTIAEQCPEAYKDFHDVVGEAVRIV